MLTEAELHFSGGYESPIIANQPECCDYPVGGVDLVGIEVRVHIV